jgi:hypothetical protein
MFKTKHILINIHLKIGNVVIGPFLFFVVFTPEKEIEKQKNTYREKSTGKLRLLTAGMYTNG